MPIPTANEIIEMSNRSSSFRREVSKRSFLHFFAYYYSHFINSSFSQFHVDMAEDMMKLVKGDYTEVLWATYRGSSKSSFAGAFVNWCIVNEYYDYLNWDSYDDTNAERAAFDIVIELQTNQKLIDDYGQLYNAITDRNVKTQKKIKDFVTTSGIRMEAFSTQVPVRGRKHVNVRPQCIISDDYEVRKTITSEALTRQIREHIMEGKAGMDPKRNSRLWLSNYISETGNVQMNIDRLQNSPTAKVRIVPLVTGVRPVWKENSPQWETVPGQTPRCAWPERFALTDEEAQQNGTVSIQQMRRDMWLPDTGEADFLLEMMCEPEAYSHRKFHRSMFQYVKFEDIRPFFTRVYFYVDPGGSSDDDDLTGKDPVGFTIAWVTTDGHWYLRSWGERLGATATIARILDTVEWLEDMGTPLTRFGWEKTQYTAGLKGQLRDEQRKRKRPFSIREMKHTRRKEERIKGSLLHRYETGMITHIVDECNDLEKQLLMFPDSVNDDIIDSAAGISELAPSVFSSSAAAQPPISKFLS